MQMGLARRGTPPEPAGWTHKGRDMADEDRRFGRAATSWVDSDLGAKSGSGEAKASRGRRDGSAAAELDLRSVSRPGIPTCPRLSHQPLHLFGLFVPWAVYVAYAHRRLPLLDPTSRPIYPRLGRASLPPDGVQQALQPAGDSLVDTARCG